jgi:hypothetical protein
MVSISRLVKGNHAERLLPLIWQPDLVGPEGGSMRRTSGRFVQPPRKRANPRLRLIQTTRGGRTLPPHFLLPLGSDDQAERDLQFKTAPS